MYVQVRLLDACAAVSVNGQQIPPFNGDRNPASDGTLEDWVSELILSCYRVLI
jgi:hypothetical protein